MSSTMARCDIGWVPRTGAECPMSRWCNPARRRNLLRSARRGATRRDRDCRPSTGSPITAPGSLPPHSPRATRHAHHRSLRCRDPVEVAAARNGGVRACTRSHRSRAIADDARRSAGRRHRAGRRNDRRGKRQSVLPANGHDQGGPDRDLGNPTLAPHVIMVEGGPDPSAVTFARPKPPSGADYSSGFADSGPIGAPPYPFRTYRPRFMRPGTYTPICSFHPGMIGRIIVTP